VAGWTQCSVKSLQARCVDGTASVPHEATTILQYIHGNDDALHVHNLLTGRQRSVERQRDASACMRRHQASALAPV